MPTQAALAAKDFGETFQSKVQVQSDAETGLEERRLFFIADLHLYLRIQVRT